jgi:hypothetical protein
MTAARMATAAIASTRIAISRATAIATAISTMQKQTKN